MVKLTAQHPEDELDVAVEVVSNAAAPSSNNLVLVSSTAPERRVFKRKALEVPVHIKQLQSKKPTVPTNATTDSGSVKFDLSALGIGTVEAPSRGLPFAALQVILKYSS